MSHGNWQLLHVPDSEKRKKLYEYLESQTVPFQGTLVEHLKHESYPFVECGENGCPGTIYLKKYRQGFMENNQDETQYGECEVCKSSYNYECNYDEPLPYINRNNVVVVFQEDNVDFGPFQFLPKILIPAREPGIFSVQYFRNRKRMKKYLHRIKNEIVFF